MGYAIESGGKSLNMGDMVSIMSGRADALASLLSEHNMDNQTALGALKFIPEAYNTQAQVGQGLAAFSNAMDLANNHAVIIGPIYSSVYYAAQVSDTYLAPI